jgi:hypothetical protein
VNKPVGRVRLVLTLPFRRRRWTFWLAALLVLPWIWMRCFTPEVGLVVLPEVAIPERTKVWVVLLDYHSSIVIEQPPGAGLGQPEAPQAPYVEYAWGDRRFYQDSNFWPQALVAAVLLPTESVTYVRSHFVGPNLEFQGHTVFAIECDAQVTRRLLFALEASMLRTSTGGRCPPNPKAEGYRGRFYPGRESYIFWSNCNRWTADRLADAGLGISPTGIVLVSQLSARLTALESLR